MVQASSSVQVQCCRGNCIVEDSHANLQQPFLLQAKLI
jgi:hypothetical protein